MEEEGEEVAEGSTKTHSHTLTTTLCVGGGGGGEEGGADLEEEVGGT